MFRDQMLQAVPFGEVIANVRTKGVVGWFIFEYIFWWIRWWEWRAMRVLAWIVEVSQSNNYSLQVTRSSQNIRTWTAFRKSKTINIFNTKINPSVVIINAHILLLHYYHNQNNKKPSPHKKNNSAAKGFSQSLSSN